MSQCMSKPEIGKRLLPHVVDEYKNRDPDKVAATFQIASGQKWHDVTYSELSNAVDYAAYYIENQLGLSNDFEMLAFLGLNDIRYTVVFLAAMKCKYTVLALSPRNSIDDHTKILEDNNCHKFLYTKEIDHTVNILSAQVGQGLRMVELQSYPEIVRKSENQKSYPYSHSFSEFWDKPAVAFQTSGTTGTPKAITLNHGYLACIDNWQRVPVPEGRTKSDITLVQPGQRFLNQFPTFHGTGAVFNIFASTFLGIVPCTLATGAPVNQDNLLLALDEIDCAAAVLPPSILEDLAIRPDAMAVLKKLKYIFFGGGPLSYKAGDILRSLTTMVQLFGGTEIGLVSSLLVDDWKYFEWNPALGLSLEEIDSSGIYEMVFHRDVKYEDFHPVFRAFPSLDVWRTRDLFRKAPEKPGLWVYEGRTDDTIVLGNAEKFNPSSLENVVQAHPLVRSALCFGQGRFQLGIIMEPEWTFWLDQEDPQSLIEQVWPLIEKQNEVSSGMGRIYKSMIMVAKKDKPFQRAAKGSLLRRASIQSYATEIDALYDSTTEAAVEFPTETDVPSLKVFVRKCFTTLFPSIDMKDDDDFFAMGVDSLQIMGVARVLQASVQAQPISNPDNNTLQQISARTIYQNPSINQLAAFLHRSLQANTSGQDDDAASRQAVLDAMVKKYSSGIPQRTHQRAKALVSGRRVILTGSTGSLGVYLLHQLLTQCGVEKVYCLNRGDSAPQRTEKALRDRGLYEAVGDLSRVDFIEVRYGDSKLGLVESKIEELLTAETCILCAWPVNFVQPLQSFEPHVRAIRFFIDISIASEGKLHLFYVSSIGAVAGFAYEHDDHDQEIPESLILDRNPTIPQGYSESKQVVERILACAAEQADIACTIARVGQVAGPKSEQGKWNDAEWLPTIIKTSKTLQKIPGNLGSMEGGGIDWVPVDKMSETAVQLLEHRLSTQDTVRLDVFHLVNPQKSKWVDVAPVVQEHFQGQGVIADIVSFEDWLTRLKTLAGGVSSPETAGQLPGLKLLDFFNGMATPNSTPRRFQTAKTENKSSTLALLEPIGPTDLKRWLKQWNY